METKHAVGVQGLVVKTLKHRQDLIMSKPFIKFSGIEKLKRNGSHPQNSVQKNSLNFLSISERYLLSCKF